MDNMQDGLKFQVIYGLLSLMELDIWSQPTNLKELSVYWVISSTMKDNGDNDLKTIIHISIISF